MSKFPSMGHIRPAPIRVEILEPRRLLSAVTGFTLIDPQTDLPIGTLTNGDTINLADLPAGKLNVRAETDNSGVASVKFGLDKKSSFAVENGSPYALFGDRNGDYRAGALSVGAHTLTATPYGRDNAKGQAGSSQTITFNVIRPTPPTPPPPQVTQFLLIDADTDQVIEPIDEGDTFNLATLPTRNLNIEAKTTGPASSVRIVLDGAAKVENSAAWAYFGNTGSNFKPGSLPVGAYALTATAFTANNARGLSGALRSVNFAVVDQGPTEPVFADGDFITYTDNGWGGIPNGTNAASVLVANYPFVYPTSGEVEIGIPGAGGFSALFTASSFVLDYLPAVGPQGTLISDSLNPTSTFAGTFGGWVLTLTLNIDFSDAGVTLGNAGIPFGDLVLTNFTDLPQLNGMTVRQFNDEVNRLLGGGSGVYSINDLFVPTADLNASFNGGTVSPFAQEHLRLPVFAAGDFVTLRQGDWDVTPLLQTPQPFATALPLGLTVGITGVPGRYSILLTNGPAVQGYLATAGPSVALTSNHIDPTLPHGGLFGGEVTALFLNIGFSDAGVLGGTFGVPFGDLTLTSLVGFPGLEGLSVRDFASIASRALGGDATGYSINTLDEISAQLNAAFLDGPLFFGPSDWAQAHLRPPG